MNLDALLYLLAGATLGWTATGLTDRLRRTNKTGSQR